MGKQDIKSVKTPICRSGTIVAVHEDRFTCDVSLDLGDGYLGDVPLQTVYLSKEGHGIYVMPEVKTRVSLVRASDDDQYAISGFLSEDEATLGDADDPDNKDPKVGPNHRMGRPVVQQGDYVLSTKGGAHVILRRNGVLEIGASPAAKRFYIPLGNLIREFAESYELRTSAGSLVLGNDRSLDPTDKDLDKTPALLQIHVKKFAEEVPYVRLEAGYIHDQQQRVPPGEDVAGTTVWRLQVGDPNDARLQDVGDFSANYEHKVSQEGTSVIRSDSSVFHEVEKTFLIRAGQYELYTGPQVLWVEGSSVERVEGHVDRKIDGALSEVIRGSIQRSCEGDVGEFIQGSHKLVSSMAERGVRGSSSDTVDGARVEITLGSYASRVNEDSVQSVGGRLDITVSNGSSDAVGGRVFVQKGKLVLRALGTSDEIDLGSGGLEDAPRTRLQIQGNGDFKLKWGGGGFFVGSANGGEWRLGNDAGFVKMSQSGVVQIGSGTGGYAITTATMPMYYVPGPYDTGSMQPTTGAGTLQVATGTGMSSIVPGPPVLPTPTT